MTSISKLFSFSRRNEIILQLLTAYLSSFEYTLFTFLLFHRKEMIKNECLFLSSILTRVLGEFS
jgi:hypothetical protein